MNILVQVSDEKINMINEEKFSIKKIILNQAEKIFTKKIHVNFNLDISCFELFSA